MYKKIFCVLSIIVVSFALTLGPNLLGRQRVFGFFRNEIEQVVIIGLDGVPTDFLQMKHPDTNQPLMPNLAYYQEHGTLVTGYNVIPPETLPNFLTMVTGMLPEKTNLREGTPCIGCIINNTPSLISEATDSGLYTAILYGKSKLGYLVPDYLNSRIYRFGPDGFDPEYRNPIHDPDIAAATIDLISRDKFDILIVLLPSVDLVGHVNGWYSPEQQYAASSADRNVGEIMASLNQKGYLSHTLVVLVNDHGGPIGRTSHKEDTQDPMNRSVFQIYFGPTIGVPIQQIHRGQEIISPNVAPTVLCALNLPTPGIWDGQPERAIFPLGKNCPYKNQ